jgi:isoleucyl-tRNA synthetase
MRADATKREPNLLRPEVYAWQQAHFPKTKRFVLHDGPPYANGSPHMGHVLNKVLKDIVCRFKIMTGHNVSYIPGWDCHGLPIEMKVLEKMSAEQRASQTPLELRRQAKAYALGQIETQKKEFMRWGVLGEWDNPYLTMQPEYEAKQISVFANMVKKGLIYRDFKPVYWSPSSKTALAEAELEYRSDHVSPSVYVLFELKELPKLNEQLFNFFAAHQSTPKKVHVSIWTTTPWTLPANLAICVGESIAYSLVVDEASDRHFIIATALVESLASVTGTKLTTVLEGISGASLVGARAVHPLDATRTSVVLAGNHVTIESGTGLVHTAPGHGQDDFAVCKLHGIPPLCPVDDSGHFTAEAGERFAGKYVLKEGNDAVIAALQAVPGALFFRQNYIHKYPYDWRTKKPVIVRATRQWFADLRLISESSVSALTSVNVVPPSGLKRLESMLGTRQDWCISRQRSWGVPIPVLYDEATDEPLLTEESIEHIRNLINLHGSDCWWSMTVDELLAREYRNDGRKYRKGSDTMDVWFDSGSSWAGVLEARRLPVPADLYVEGSDQHRGWFQSSLLTCVAVHAEAPYKTLVTHGFLLDEKQQKMSKSLGNVIEPSYVIEGGKNKQRSPAYGVDVMRLWVASTDYTDDVIISDGVLAATFNSAKKIRNTARFLLGVLNDFSPLHHSVPYENLRALDQYMLHRLAIFVNNVNAAYNTYAFYSVIREVNHFVNTELSAFYLTILKDRLYSPSPNHPARRAAQTTAAHILDALAKVLAPILVHTSEDIFQHLPWRRLKTSPSSTSSSSSSSSSSSASPPPSPPLDPAAPVTPAVPVAPANPINSIFFEGWPDIPAWNKPSIANAWNLILEIRTHAYRLIEHLRSAQGVSTSSEIDIHIYTTQTHPIRSIPISELEELFICAHVFIHPIESAPESASSPDTHSGEPFSLHLEKSHKHKCPRCWRYVAESADQVCAPCDVALKEIGFQSL